MPRCRRFSELFLPRVGLVLDQIVFSHDGRWSTDEVFLLFLERLAAARFDRISMFCRARDGVSPAPYALDPSTYDVHALPWYRDISELCARLPFLLPRITSVLADGLPKCDLIVGFGIHPVTSLALRMARRRNVPSVFWVRGDLLTDIRRRLHGVKKWAGLAAARVCLAAVPSGTPVVSMGRDDFPFLKRMGDVQVAYSSKFGSGDVVASPRSPGGRAGESARVLYVGRLAPEKGLRVLLEAMRILRERLSPPPQLTIVGSDFFGSDYGDTLIREVRASSLDEGVRFLGHVPYGEALFAVYDTHEVLVLPSLTEGFPQVLLEAMARGVPIVATRVGGVPRLVSSGQNGILVPAGDAVALAAAIEGVLGDPSLWRRLTAGGRATALSHTSDAQAHLVLEFLDRCYPGSAFARRSSDASGRSAPPPEDDAPTNPPRIVLPEATLDVSVVIPIRNEARYIDRCLDSVLSQECEGLTVEVLLVDGLSDDGTREAILRRATIDSRVRLLDNHARKVSPALNVGLRAARGRVLVRLDAHSTYAPDYLRSCLRVLAETGADAVGGVQIPAPGATTRMARAIAAAQTSALGTGLGRHRRRGYEGPAETLWLGAFKRELVEQIGGFDEDLFRSEDNDFFQRARAAGGRLWVSARIRAEYLCRPDVPSYAKQCWTTGTEILPTMIRNPRAMALRHFAPAVALSASVALGGAALLGPSSVRVASTMSILAAAGLYAAATVAAAGNVARRKGADLFPALLGVFPVAHFAYAAGTLAGMVRAARRRIRSNPRSTGAM